jgi:gamma-glutamyl hercynylcysteine S-oxide synthase
MHSTVSAAAKLLETIDSAEASLAERIAAGEALAALGDPRAKAIDRVAIPAGVLAPAKGHREHEARVAPFSIDRYPVTVAAYAEFIEVGGYDDPSLWSARGWVWRTAERICAPRFWDDASWSAYLVPNHPVVGVSAYEAEAYASLRGARLPTEAEWEWACRGPSGACYPWGDAWEEDACGERGHGPRGTVPIGVFPKGASPFGVRDMVGSVWQWCSDVAAGNAKGEETMRITRGGAWNNLAWSISCTSRNAFPHDARFSNLGFRCVV